MSNNYLLDLLRLEVSASDTSSFVAPAAAERHVRAFGGRTVAQALMAAGQTIDPGRYVHSLHAYFLRPGNSAKPMTCQVQNLRDGRSFSSRRTEAIQDGGVILEMLASFHAGEAGPHHQDAMPRVPKPETLAPFEDRFSGRRGEDDMARWFFRAEPFDIRYVDNSPFEGDRSHYDASQKVWFKAKALPDEPLLHTAALTYASDMTILDPVLLRHGLKWTDRKMLGATLDHAIWFHRPVDFSQWLLFDQHSSIAENGRALAMSKVWTQSGDLVATVNQEALMRPIDA